MDNNDYTNWDYERNKVIDEVLRILREQEDLAQNFIQSGDIQFNPQVFSGGFKHLTVGPIGFGTSYASPPQMFFGQKPNLVRTDFVTGQVTGYTPYLVNPYVYDYSWTTGAVDGFYLGLYAPEDQTVDPTLTLTSVSWLALGNATRYRKERTQEAWTSPNDFNEPDYLVDNG